MTQAKNNNKKFKDPKNVQQKKRRACTQKIMDPKNQEDIVYQQDILLKRRVNQFIKYA